MPQVLLLCGSLRAGSINHILLDAAAQMAPSDVVCSRYTELASLPLYNQDEDTAQPPPAVARLREAIAKTDGLIIAMPEYNFGIPGVLKNAIDWASRPYGKSSLCGKVVVVLVATMGAGFGFLGHGQLRATLSALENFVVPAPLVVVQRGHERLRRSADGQAIFDDPMGHLLLAANWAALRYAIEHRAGEISMFGSRALAQAGKP